MGRMSADLTTVLGGREDRTKTQVSGQEEKVALFFLLPVYSGVLSSAAEREKISSDLAGGEYGVTSGEKLVAGQDSSRQPRGNQPLWAQGTRDRTKRECQNPV